MGCYGSKVSKFNKQNSPSSEQKIENLLTHNELYSKQCKRKSYEYDNRKKVVSFKANADTIPSYNDSYGLNRPSFNNDM